MQPPNTQLDLLANLYEMYVSGTLVQVASWDTDTIVPLLGAKRFVISGASKKNTRLHLEELSISWQVRIGGLKLEKFSLQINKFSTANSTQLYAMLSASTEGSHFNRTTVTEILRPEWTVSQWSSRFTDDAPRHPDGCRYFEGLCKQTKCPIQVKFVAFPDGSMSTLHLIQEVSEHSIGGEHALT